MLYSKVTQKGQATIPAEIRHLLNLHTGDAVEFQIENGKVTVSKVEKLDIHYARALNYTLSEWDSPQDDEAYSDL